MQYQTKPRQKIIKYIQNKQDEPFTTEEVIAFFDNKISTATIYRTLEQLVETNELRKYFLNPPSVAHYQSLDASLNCEEHFHLVCTNCGKLFHIDCIVYQDLTVHLLKEHQFKMDEKQTVIYGWCQDCQVELESEK